MDRFVHVVMRCRKELKGSSGKVPPWEPPKLKPIMSLNQNLIIIRLVLVYKTLKGINTCADVPNVWVYHIMAKLCTHDTSVCLWLWTIRLDDLALWLLLNITMVMINTRCDESMLNVLTWTWLVVAIWVAFGSVWFVLFWFSSVLGFSLGPVDSFISGWW